MCQHGIAGSPSITLLQSTPCVALAAPRPLALLHLYSICLDSEDSILVPRYFTMLLLEISPEYEVRHLCHIYIKTQGLHGTKSYANIKKRRFIHITSMLSFWHMLSHHAIAFYMKSLKRVDEELHHLCCNPQSLVTLQ